jgi:hypothetical protein
VEGGRGRLVLPVVVARGLHVVGRAGGRRRRHARRDLRVRLRVAVRRRRGLMLLRPLHFVSWAVCGLCGVRACVCVGQRRGRVEVEWCAPTTPRLALAPPRVVGWWRAGGGRGGGTDGKGEGSPCPGGFGERQSAFDLPGERRTCRAEW